MTEERVDYSVVPFETVMAMGEVFAKSGYFTDAREQAQAVVKMLAGREMGVGAFASMSGIHIIQGKPEVGAHLLAAVLKRSGKYTYRVQQPLKPDSVSIEFFEGGQSIGVSTFTAEDAKKAGTGNMQKFPRNMLFARALSNGVKWYCPDVSLSPLYSRGEFDHAANVEYVDDADVVDAVVTEVAQKQTPEQNGDRPYVPDVLRDKLRTFAVLYAEEDGDAPADMRQQQMIAACLDKLCHDTPRRRIFTGDVFGWKSTADMKLAQFHALNKWMGLKSTGSFEVDSDVCQGEANRLVNAAVTEQATGELFEEEPNDVG